jgi:hypothetical protein
MDYYLKTTTKEDFLQDIQKIIPQLEELDTYYQDHDLILDWIGTIYYPFETNEMGEIIGEIIPREGQYLNIRSREPIDISVFTHTDMVYPEIPQRVFS